MQTAAELSQQSLFARPAKMIGLCGLLDHEVKREGWLVSNEAPSHTMHVIISGGHHARGAVVPGQAKCMSLFVVVTIIHTNACFVHTISSQLWPRRHSLRASPACSSRSTPSKA